MGAMKRKAAEVSLVSGEEKWRRKVGALKSKPKPVSFGSGEKWVRGKKIGEGGFGSVFVAFSKSRYMPRAMAIKSAEMNESDSIQYELQVYQELDGDSCPFIIEHYGEEVTLSSKGEKFYNLALEIAWGSLAEWIKVSGKGGLPEKEVKGYAGQILKGVKHMHDCGYVHCDLKPDNILLVGDVNVDGKPVFTAKVGDFGLAKKEEEVEGGWRGTPNYLAPETITENRQEKPSDIWAVGLIVLEMLTGERARHLFYESETGCFCIVDRRMKPEIPDTLSTVAMEFIDFCLEEVPEHRWTAEELLSLPFVAAVR
ncbi:PREDICTED: mitogen-activated protein kinase kinase kinase ANP1-like [Fragaria vesca subsp. vesca]|uniref:mitogen-activated protein kinase kinase kinase ANP1-like n=1 Tax=Fragaria vesca subsp. vesca TaxID=101020 RepID=UPI0002C347D4|nr:PREDICTED: mitogen-activated protein kinase kinase kinase ANP1-like [Fragaria vesca subsp. vesca]